MRTRRRHRKNIRPWKGGFQTYVEVGGHPFYLSWPANASDDDMLAWVEQQKTDHKVIGPTRGSFAADVQDYLSRIAAARNYRLIAAYLERWLLTLGRDRPRRGIKTAEIDRALQDWQTEGAGLETLRKLRTYLMALWNRLDGKAAPNPVRTAWKPRAAKAEARSLPYPTIAKILAAMAIRTEKQRQIKRRVTVVACTGLPPGMLGDVTSADLNLHAKTVRVRPRRKGQGVEARTLQLSTAGVQAFRAFHLANDYGAFREDVTNREFKRAARSIGIEGATVYDLRHSFLTLLYEQVRDLATVARFACHASVAMSQRYAQAANSSVDRAAAKALGRSLSLTPVQSRKLSMKTRK